MYKKKGFPEVGDFVICTIKRVLPSSTFVDLDEYENKEGMIHVSEMPKKLVMNMKTYLKPDKKLVCKVMDVEPEKNFVNLSIRRVGAAQHRNKLNDWNNEKRANDILEVFAKMNDLTVKQVYAKIGDKLLEEYGLLFPFLQDVAKEGKKPLTDIGIEENLAEKLAELIQKRIAVAKADIEGVLRISSTKPDGLEVIKTAIKNAEELAGKKKAQFSVKYLGAPKYKFKIVAENFKLAEDMLEEITKQTEDFMEHNDGWAEFKRD